MSEHAVVIRQTCGRDLMPAFKPERDSSRTLVTGAEDPCLGREQTLHVERHKPEIAQVAVRWGERIREFVHAAASTRLVEHRRARSTIQCASSTGVCSRSGFVISRITPKRLPSLPRPEVPTTKLAFPRA